MTLDINSDMNGYHYTIEDVFRVQVDPLKLPMKRKFTITIFGKKLISELLYECDDRYRSEHTNLGLCMELGMLVMCNSKESQMTWDLKTESDMLQMCNQIQLLMGLEET